MKTIVSLGLSTILLAATPGRGQVAEPPLLTLDEAIALATTAPDGGNHRLGAADARLEAARAGMDEARSERLPRVELQGGFERTDNPVLVFSRLLAQENFKAENFELDALNRPDPLSDWNLRLSFEQPLWTGGRISSLEESARRHHEGEDAGRERTRQQVVLEVTASYVTAVLARHRLEVAREAVETAAAHVSLISDLWEGGLVVESDLLLAQVRESEVREVLIRAESGVEISRAALNLALGRDLSTPFTLPETLQSETLDPDDRATDGRELGTDPDSLLDALVERARTQRPDLRAARQRRAAVESQVELARSEKRPQVAFQAAYEAHTGDFPELEGDSWALGIGVRLAVFDGLRTRSRVEQARARVRETDELNELLAQSIALDVRRSFHELRAARQRLQQASKAVSLARRSLGIVEDRYKEGLITLPGLLDAETALTEARLREVAARRDVILARADLDLATGDL